MDECPICLMDLSSDKTHTLRNCKHVFHEMCIWTLYQETSRRYDEATGRRLKPTCPMCRAPFSAGELPSGPFVNPVAAARFREEAQRVISEPAFAAMPAQERPLRLAREIVLIERAERQAALDRLIEERDRLRAVHASRQVSSAPRPPLGAPEPRPSTSQGSSNSPARKKSRRAVMESDTSSSSASSPVKASQKPASSTKGVISEPVARSSSPVAGPSGLQVVSQSASTGGSSPAPGNQSPEMRALNLRIHVAQAQLSQMSDDSNPRVDLEQEEGDELEPAWEPLPGEEDIQPLAIIGNWGRGRHMRYRIRWSDGSVSLNRTREVEVRAMGLLENYRRDLNRQRVARTRERQRSGEAPRIAGRGRGRGRGSSAGSSGSRGRD